MVTSKFFIALDKVWKYAIDRLVSPLGKIHSGDHLSYTKIPYLHMITYITEIRKTLCTGP